MMNVQNALLYHLLLLTVGTRLSQAFAFSAAHGQRRVISRKTSSSHGQQPPLDATLSSNDEQQPYTSLLPSNDERRQEEEKKAAVDSFVALLEASLMTRNESSSPSSSSFQSFTFYGPSKKQAATFLQDNNNNSNGNNDEAENMARGCIRRVDGRRIVLKKKKQAEEQNAMMIQVTFKYILATDIVKNWSSETVASNVRSLLQFGYTVTRQESSEWATLKQQPQQLSQKDMEQLLAIQRAVLETTEATIELVDLNSGKKKPRLLKKKKKNSNTSSTTASTITATAATPLKHDRIKKVPLPLKLSASTSGTGSSDCSSTRIIDFWQALGLTNAQGQPKPSGGSKIRQAQKFVEIVSGLVDTALLVVASDNDNMTSRGISIVDMGCGRGYLTFALHSFLTQKYAAAAAVTTTTTTDDMKSTIMLVKSRGIDVRPKLVNEISVIAESLGHNFEHLSFAQGTIQDVLQNSNNNNSIFQWSANNEEQGQQQQQQQHDSLKVLIALHACDTATDDAIWAGIVGQADVIVVAPCCHQQLRPQIDRHYYSSSSSSKQQSSSSSHDAASWLMADVLRHNIYRERITETVTDAMRALLLEWAGYTPVKVFEFVGGEHTSKNVMITAMKGRQRRPRQSSALAAKQKDELRQRLQTLGDFYGVHEHKLATWMGISLAQQQHEQQSTINGDMNDASPLPFPPLRKRRLSARNMPPL